MTTAEELVEGAWSRRTLPAALNYWADRQPEERFFRCGEDWVSYGQARRQVRNLAARLIDNGVRKGDRVALISQNTNEAVFVLLSLAHIGAIAVPLNVFLKGEFLRFQLADCAASTLFTDAAGMSSVAAVADALPGLKYVVKLEEEGRSFDALADRRISTLQELMSRQSSTDVNDVHYADPLCIIYSSGTTGMPKGCICSHGYHLASSIPAIECGWYGHGDVIYTAFPLFHTAGYGLMLGGALQAGASICLDKTFSASGFLPRVREIGATTAHGVGPMAMAILATAEQPDDADNTLRRCTWVPLPAASQLAFESRFGVDVIAAAYGQTEATPIAMLSAVDSKSHREALGKPVSYMEVQIVNDEDEPVSVGQIGEITMRPKRTEAMFQGYWGRPEEALKASRNLWHHTGDLGRIDEDGFLQFSDRKKDMIRRRGENVSSFELETAIRRHPEIVDVAAFAVSSPMGEDDIKVCIQAAPGENILAKDLFDYFGSNLPYFAIPRFVECVEELPANANGRVMKHLLRDVGVKDTDWDFEALGFAIEKEQRRGG